MSRLSIQSTFLGYKKILDFHHFFDFDYESTIVDGIIFAITGWILQEEFEGEAGRSPKGQLGLCAKKRDLFIIERQCLMPRTRLPKPCGKKD